MCGLAGIYGIDNKQGHAIALQAVQSMTDRIAHRGPDAEGIWSDNDEVILGHRRLSIIDTSDASNQPFCDPVTGNVLVFNGEVYNYKELREPLSKTHQFRTDSDTEVVLAALTEWGPEALNAFNGMFALAFWDASKRELFIARDRLGIKPLYYSEAKNCVLFSSEVRSLLASGWIPRKHDRVALADYMRYQTVHAPRTMVEGIKLLEPGHWMRLQGEEMEMACWWDAASAAKDRGFDLPRVERIKRIREALEQSIQLRMRSDVPLGAFLSGGIDSSAVVGLMQSVSARPISTFSVTFDEGEFDESRWSRMIANKFNTDHHEIRLSATDFLRQVPDSLKAMDHPSGDGPNTYVVSAATKGAGITVALSGLGGDELFAGYPVFKRSKELLDARWLASWPRGLRKLAGKLYTQIQSDVTARKKADILAGEYFDLEHTYPLSRQVFLESDIRRMAPSLSSHPNAVHGWLAQAIRPGSHGFELPFLSQVSIAEIYTYMGHTLLRDTDQMSMAHALEVRVPFLDHRVVAEALAAPDEHKWPATPKQLLTDALPDLLPNEIIHRPKMGFTLPWEEWMRNDLRAICEEGISFLGQFEVISANEIQRMWQSFLANDRRWSHARLWSLVVLGHWMKENEME